MARPRRDLPPDQFTSAEMALAGKVSLRNFGLLCDEWLFPEGEGTKGKGGSLFWRTPGLGLIAVIGAFNRAGVELVVAARLAKSISDEFELVYGRMFSRLDSYIMVIRSRADRCSDAFSWLTENEEVYTDDYWLHHFLRTRTDLYRKNTAFDDDVKFEIVDRAFVFRRAALPKPSPWCRIVAWEKGDNIVIMHTHDEVDPSNLEDTDRLEEEYADAYKNAVGLLKVNISLAIRNALDAVHEHRNVT